MNLAYVKTKSKFFFIYIFRLEIYMSIEVININNVARLEVYNSDPAVNTSATNYVSFTEFKEQVEKCKIILEDCIKNSPSVKTIKIYLGYILRPFNPSDKTLGWAGGGTIAINQYNTGYYYLNDGIEHQNISVIIHEIFHVFGLFPDALIPGLIEQRTDSLDSTVRRVYLGNKGLNGYKKVLLANNIFVPDPLYICIEDDFEDGTVNVHLEEAYNSSSSQYEVIKIGDQYYPTLWNEIMSGLLDRDNNYITPITMGCLEDLNYVINYDSPYIVTNGTNMKFVNNQKSKQNGTITNYLTLGNNLYNLKYLNDILKQGDLLNRSLILNDLQNKWGEKITR